MRLGPGAIMGMGRRGGTEDVWRKKVPSGGNSKCIKTWGLVRLEQREKGVDVCCAFCVLSKKALSILVSKILS